MISVADIASKAVMRDFGELEKLQISRKGSGNFFTNIDVKIEKIIHERLAKYNKDYGFLMEESGEVPPKNKDDYFQWVVDPIDGTSNFIHGNPNFCISIGLRHVKNGHSELIAGVIAVPVANEIYWAEKDKGAYLHDSNQNNSRLRVSVHDDLERVHFATCSPTSKSEPHNKLLEMCYKNRIKLRISGSAALDLAYVACGKIDLFFQHKLNLWDIAAGLLIIKEASGIVKDISGLEDVNLNNDKIGVLVGNQHIIKKVG